MRCHGYVMYDRAQCSHELAMNMSVGTIFGLIMLINSYILRVHWLKVASQV